MLSICIPIYDFDVRELVNDLTNQIKKAETPCDLILIDDKSTDEFRAINKPTCENHTYVELPENIGRSRIRNLFLNYTRNDYLLFLDCDVKIISSDFISNYIDLLTHKPEVSVACGGRHYPEVCNDKNHKLRWKYGIRRENVDLTTREKHPWKSFLSNNFVVKRQILQQFPFDERLSEYGHEDTLFGFSLKQHGVMIHYFDNAVLNNDIEESTLFLKKTEKGMQNLVKILTLTHFNNDLIEDIKILNVFFKIEKNNLMWLIRGLAFFIRRPIKFLLEHKYSYNLFLFDLFKLFMLEKYYRNLSHTK